MTPLRVLLSRVLEFVLRRRRDARLDEEIQAHLDLLAEQYIADGMAPADARRAARRSFGGIEQIKADHRDQRGLPVVDALLQDVRFAVRLLGRERGFAIAAVGVLALGIGVNNMLFTILNAHTLRGLPIPAAGRVLALSAFDDRGRDFGLSHREFVDLRERGGSFSALIALAGAQMIVSGDGLVPERFEGAYLSGGAFDVIGGEPALGRALTAADDRPAAPPVALIGEAAWQTRYGGDRSVLGRSILVDGAPATIVGVMPDAAGLPTSAQIWLPLVRRPAAAAADRVDRSLRVFGRVRDGVEIAAAEAEAAGVLEPSFRDTAQAGSNIRPHITPINDRYFGSWNEPAWFAFITAGFLIVIISAANVANLVLAHAVTRNREIAVRASLGASRARIARQLLIEGTVLAVFGAIGGLAVSVAGVRVFRRAVPDTALPYWVHYSIDVRVLTALILVAAGTIFVFALVPAMYASRSDVNGVLKEGGVAAGGRGARRWTTAFLTAEFALAVVLLAQVSVSLRNRAERLPSDDAIETRSVLTAAVTLPTARYPAPEHRLEFHRQLRERLQGIADVAANAIISAPPLTGAPESRVEIAGRPAAAVPDDAPAARVVVTGVGLLETLDLRPVRGRDLASDDGLPGKANVVVNEEFVRRFLPGADPIGQRIALTPAGQPERSRSWAAIVGVAPDIRQQPRSTRDPIVYVPYASEPNATMTLLVRSRGDATTLGLRLREAAAAIDSGLPLYRMRVLADVVRDATWNGRLARSLILVLTLIAVGLSTVGLYAVTSHAVSLRVQELGIRVALGASRRHVAALVFRRALWQLAIGFVAGLGCSFLWHRAFTIGADRLSGEAASLGWVVAVLLFVTVLACAMPIRRAMRLDPVAAIRHG